MSADKPVSRLTARGMCLTRHVRLGRRWLVAVVTFGLLLASSTALFDGEVSVAGGSAEIQTPLPGQVIFTSASTDDGPGAADPGQPDDVASCTAKVLDHRLVEISILNGNPGYTCTFRTTVYNRSTLPACLDRLEYRFPPALAVDGRQGLAGLVLEPGHSAVQAFSVRVGQGAVPGATYGFRVTAHFRAEAPGSAPCGRRANP